MWKILGNYEEFWEILGNFATIYALSCGAKLSPKVNLWRKNDKYQVWYYIVLYSIIVYNNIYI